MNNTKIENFQKKSHSKKIIDEEISQQLTVTSFSESELEHEDNKILLEDSQNKNIFLSKVSLVFIVYFLLVNIEIYIIKRNPDMARLQYIHSKLNVLLYLYLIISFVIKIMFTLFGQFIRKLAPAAFILDLYLTYMIVLGSYFKLNSSGIYHSNNSSNVVDLISFVMFFSFIGFFMSTIYIDERKIYNPFLGLGLVLLFQAGALAMHKYQNQVVPLSSTLYLKTGVVLFFVNIYICFNSYLIVNYRTSKYYESDIFYCTLCYWGDWINNVWIDLVKTGKQLHEENNLNYQENRQTFKINQSQELQQKIQNLDLAEKKGRKTKDLKVRITKLKETN